jgi:hypothetical protein
MSSPREHPHDMPTPGSRAWVVSAVYRKPEIAAHAGNPLIEALPPVYTDEQAAEMLAHYPKYQESFRREPDHVRLLLVQEGMKFFAPLDVHLDLNRRFANLIRIGYAARNPMGRYFWSGVQQRIDCFDQYGDQPNPEIGGDASAVAAGFQIVGISGVGKSRSVSRILLRYPQVIWHSQYRDQNFAHAQLTWLKLDCPFDGNPRGMCIEFFKKVDAVLGTKYHRRYAGERRIQAELLSDMATVAANHLLGVLVIDEVQRLSMAKSGGAERMLNFFTQLINEIGVPVVLVGTFKALPVLTGDFSQLRRGTGQGDLIWDRMKQDDQWHLFIESLWRFQYVRTECPLTKKLGDVLYDESQGITDLAVKIYMFAQERAIDTGEEQITAEIIRSAAKDKLGLLRRVLQALKAGDRRALEEYEDVYPATLKEYLQNLPESNPAEVVGQVGSSPEIEILGAGEHGQDAGAPPAAAENPIVATNADSSPKKARVPTNRTQRGRSLAAKGELPKIVAGHKGAGDLAAYEALRRKGYIKGIEEGL